MCQVVEISVSKETANGFKFKFRDAQLVKKALASTKCPFCFSFAALHLIFLIYLCIKDQKAKKWWTLQARKRTRRKCQLHKLPSMRAKR